MKHIKTKCFLKDPFPYCHKNGRTYPLYYGLLHHRIRLSGRRHQFLQDNPMHQNVLTGSGLTVSPYTRIPGSKRTNPRIVLILDLSDRCFPLRMHCNAITRAKALDFILP